MTKSNIFNKIIFPACQLVQWVKSLYFYNNRSQYDVFIKLKRRMFDKFGENNEIQNGVCVQADFIGDVKVFTGYQGKNVVCARVFHFRQSLSNTSCVGFNLFSRFF